MALTAHGRNRIYQAFGFSVAAFFAIPALFMIISLFTDSGGEHTSGSANSDDVVAVWIGLFTVWYAAAAVLTVWLSRLRVVQDDDWQVDPRQAGPLMLLSLLAMMTLFGVGGPFPTPWRFVPIAIAVAALLLALLLRSRTSHRSPDPAQARPRPAPVAPTGSPIGGVFPEPDPSVWLSPPPTGDIQAWVDQTVPDLLHRIDQLGGGTGAGARLRVDDPDGYLRAVLHRIAAARADDTDPFLRLPQRKPVHPELSCIGLVKYRIDAPAGELQSEVAGPEGGRLKGEPEIAEVGPWQRTVQQIVESDGALNLSARYTRRAALAPGHEVDVLVDGLAAWELRDDVLDDLDALALSVRIVNAAGGTA